MYYFFLLFFEWRFNTGIAFSCSLTFGYCASPNDIMNCMNSASHECVSEACQSTGYMSPGTYCLFVLGPELVGRQLELFIYITYFSSVVPSVHETLYLKVFIVGRCSTTPTQSALIRRLKNL